MNENNKSDYLINELIKRVEVSELDIKEIKEEIAQIKQNEVGYQKDITRIFEVNKETKELYKENTDKIFLKLDNLEKKPLDTYEKIKIALITAMCTGLVAMFIAIITKTIKL